MENNAFEDWVALKDFLDQLLRDGAHQVHTTWLDWVQAKKTYSEADNAFFQRFDTLKTRIGDEANDPAMIEGMLFFARLDESMQQKIRKQSSMPETTHDLVALAKKLQPNLDRGPTPSLSTRTWPIFSTSALPEQIDTPVASSLHEESRRNEVFCSYCGKKKPQRGAMSEEIPQC